MLYYVYSQGKLRNSYLIRYVLPTATYYYISKEGMKHESKRT